MIELPPYRWPILRTALRDLFRGDLAAEDAERAQRASLVLRHELGGVLHRHSPGDVGPADRHEAGHTELTASGLARDADVRVAPLGGRGDGRFDHVRRPAVTEGEHRAAPFFGSERLGCGGGCGSEDA